MKRICFLVLILVCSIYASACHSQSESADKSSGVFFDSEEALVQYVQKQNAALLEPAAYLPISKLFPNDEMRHAIIDSPNFLNCGIYVTKEKDYMRYRLWYESDSTDRPLVDIIKGNYSFSNTAQIVIQNEKISTLSNPLRSISNENASCQIFTVSGIPIAYTFLGGKILSICFVYKDFILDFGCRYPENSHFVIDWDTPANSSYMKVIQNLTDPQKAEQEMRRLQNIIDNHLENITE